MAGKVLGNQVFTAGLRGTAWDTPTSVRDPSLIFSSLLCCRLSLLKLNCPVFVYCVLVVNSLHISQYAAAFDISDANVRYAFIPHLNNEGDRFQRGVDPMRAAAT